MNFRTVKSCLLLGAAFAGTPATPAFAQEKATDDSQTGDIIVTAQRVEQRLQDVPISITVVTPETLTKRNIAVAADLATYTPSLSVNTRYGPEKSNFNIRGFNQDASTAPTVGVYFAEVVGVRAQGGTTSGNTVPAGSFTDLQNVQVLKGPQGTLFGRNTTGGAVLLTPKKPTDKLEGYVEGTYGNYDNKRVQAALNIPLSDTFKIRASIDRNKRDGYMKNLATNAAGNHIGPDAYNNLNYFYGRLSIVADLTPDLENYTIFHYSNSDTNGYASKITGCATPTSPIAPLNTVAGSPGYSATRHLQATSCAIQLARQTARGDGMYDIETSNANPFLRIKEWQVINTTTWKASDSITIKNIASYGEFSERANFDLGSSNFVVAPVDSGVTLAGQPAQGFLLNRVSPRLPAGIVAAAGTPYQRIVLDTAGANVDNSSESTATEELQIQGNTLNGKLNFVVGGYLEFSRPLGFSGGRTGIFLNCTRPEDLACSNPLLFGSISESSTKLAFDNHGVFGQATYNFTEKLALTGGFRYTFDKIDGLTQGTRASLATATTPGAFQDPNSGVYITRACTDSFRHLTATPGLDRSVCNTNLTNKSSKPTWVVDVDYKPTPDLLFYAKYARGYRQGGLNFTNPGVESWKPEQTDNFEVGAKSTFRGAVSGYLNFAAFYNKLQNQQIFAQLIPDATNAALGVAGGNAVVNAGRSRIYGAEVDASALFFDSLRFDVGYTYLNTKIVSAAPAALRGDGTPLGTLLVGSPFGSISPTAVVGSSFTYTPRHRVSATATYTLPLDESIGKISLAGTLVYTSSQINDGAVPAYVNGQPLGVTPANTLVNLNLDWKGVAHSPVDLAFFVTNLTKKAINVASTGAWISAGVAEVLLNQPRMYGVRLRYTFGQ